MTGFGSSVVMGPSNNDPDGTLCTVGLYGPRGGNAPFAVLDRAGVERLISDLSELLDEPVDDKTMVDAIACAVGDAFPESRQHVRTHVARSALARYRRDGGRTIGEECPNPLGCRDPQSCTCGAWGPPKETS